MAEALLKVDSVTKNFGGFTALSEVTTEVKAGERFGLIGPNGSGKTTLINCISGTLTNDGGSIIFDGQDLQGMKAHVRTAAGITRTFQIPRPFHSMTIIDNLKIPLEFVSASGRAQTEIRDEAMSILETMGMAEKADEETSGLTQIELRKLELARAIAAKPKLLISDEAMAGLTGNEVDEVTQILINFNEQGMTIIMIEHIMRAVMQFSQRVICLDAGQLIAEGTPDIIQKDKGVERAYLGV
ncbi:MAG: ABC transporter ATP-binding protein [Alphaproteobacteria bacterium]|nr:ABC transporter ATP-binding protein [Alphaproteobacteria bacterium]PPR13090.1 MAG: Lipopolysaccharide export system ATP-binding protein LptB [Alphaproteobacteria bacterium MarineAlpha12_Bin1]|tara:strand:- start:802 stop:1527 length:726 start_codon:yes stop_codon:yes gene_type:complete